MTAITVIKIAMFWAEISVWLGIELGCFLRRTDGEQPQ